MSIVVRSPLAFPHPGQANVVTERAHLAAGLECAAELRSLGFRFSGCPRPEMIPSFGMFKLQAVYHIYTRMLCIMSVYIYIHTHTYNVCVCVRRKTEKERERERERGRERGFRLAWLGDLGLRALSDFGGCII